MSPLRRRKLVPLKHQIKATKEVLAGLKKHARVQLIMACGTGKTLVSLTVAEQGRFKVIVVFVPSLALVRQMLGEYSASTSWDKWEAIAVCSDPSVTEDSVYISPQEVGCEVTTERERVVDFINKTGVRVVFCTYHSAHLLKDLEFDFGIFDEAHKTAGKQGKAFAFALDDDNVGIRKRLFMTATPRHVRVVNSDGDEQPIFSMKDEKTYGPVAHQLSFRDAISQGLICDYKIAICALLEDVNTAGYKPAQVALRKAMINFGTKKVITFHSTIKRAQEFAADEHQAMKYCAPLGHPIPMWHVNGKMSTEERDHKMQEMVATGGVVTNVRCLSEGVDFPDVDMVAFMDPKRSPIDIVQVVGRCLRPDRERGEKKQGIVFVPVYIKPGENDEVAVANSKFDHVYDVLQAMKEQDPLLAEELRTLGDGKHKSYERRVIVCSNVGMEKLSRAISVRLARAVGRDPDWKKRALLALPIDSPRPRQGTTLGNALRNYTLKVSDTYDGNFETLIRKQHSNWFIDRVAQKKRELLTLPAGTPRPHYLSRLGNALRSYLDRNGDCHDGDFEILIRKQHPDWFIDRVAEKKRELLALPTGTPRPISGKHGTELGNALVRYTSHKGIKADPSFYQQIRDKQPDWFTNKFDEVKNTLRALPPGAPRPHSRKTQEGKLLVLFTCKKAKQYDPQLDLELRVKHPDWWSPEILKQRLSMSAKQRVVSRPEGNVRYFRIARRPKSNKRK